MRRKSSGVAVIAILVGVAVAVTLYIASFGKSHHASAPTMQNEAVAQHDAASDATFAIAPLHAASDTEAQTASP
jgi:type II secretory pathway component PulK